MPPQYQQVQIGLRPGTIETLDQLTDGEDPEFASRSAAVRHFVEEGLSDER